MFTTFCGWFCWPWFKRDPAKREKFDVGISVAEAVLKDGTLITITRKGRAIGDGWTVESEGRLSSTMYERWILADNKTYYNRDYIISYTVDTKQYWVYEDNTVVK